MAQKSLRPSQLTAIVGAIDPDATATGTVETGWISIAKFSSIMALVMVGQMNANSTVDAKLEQATDAIGTNAKDVEGAAITTLTQAGDNDSDKQAILECFGEDLDIKNDFAFVRLSVTVAGASTDLGATVLGLGPRYGPASSGNLASVAEIVAAQSA